MYKAVPLAFILALVLRETKKFDRNAGNLSEKKTNSNHHENKRN